MKITDIIEHENFELLILGCCLGLAGVLYFKIREIVEDFKKVNRENLAHIMAINTFVAAEVFSIEQYDSMYQLYYNALIAAEEEEE